MALGSHRHQLAASMSERLFLVMILGRGKHLLLCVISSRIREASDNASILDSQWCAATRRTDGAVDAIVATGQT